MSDDFFVRSYRVRRSGRLAGAAGCWLAACADPVGPGPDRPADPAELVSATATVHSISQATVTVTLTAEADVAAACVRRDDPSEVHLVEGTASPTADLRFAGLLASTDYDCAVALASGDGDPLTTSLRTNDPPAEASVASADVTTAPGAAMTGAYTVMNVKPECRADNDRNYLAVLDPEGNNRWRYELPTGMNIGINAMLDGPNRILWGGGDTLAGDPQVVDVRHGPVWTLGYPGSEAVEYHHDARRIADGRVLSVEHDLTPGWLATVLRLSNDAHETTWTWSMEQAVAAGELSPVEPGDDDPHHVNWADVVDAGDGPVAYLSLCFAELIIAVDVATGKVLWRFGEDADFTLVDDSGAPADPDDFPECQHGLQTDGTHLLVFDNGFDRGYTRAVEYELDLATRTATKTWEFLDDGYWSLYHGGVEWLTPDHSRVLVAESSQNCDPGERAPQIVEVDRARGDLVVHRMVLREVSDWIYRAHRVDGCDLFANTKYCPALAARLDELRPALGL